MGISASPNVRAIVFLKIELTGLTLRFATENITAKDTDGTAYFWEGRLSQISQITSGFNDFKDAQAITSSIGISLSNGKDAATGSTLDSYISSYAWGNKLCTVFLALSTQTTSSVSTLASAHYTNWLVGPQNYLGPQKYIGALEKGTVSSDFQLSTSDIIFKGVTGFPDTLKNYNDVTIDFDVLDSRYFEQILACPRVFARDGYVSGYNTITSSLLDGVEGETIPILYGDFSDDYLVPAFGIIAGVTRYYQIADDQFVAAGQTPITEVTSIKAQDGTVTSITTSATDLTAGSFPAAIMTPTNPACKCKGKSRGTQIASVFGGNATDLLEHPVEVIYDLVYSRLGVAAADIDSTTFLALQAADTSLKCRRWVGSSESLVDILNDLCFEFGYDLYSLFGKFYISKQALSGASSLSLTQDDLDPSSYSLAVDPNRAYFNKVALKMRQNPYTKNYDRTIAFANYLKINFHGITQSQTYELKWHFLEFAAISRFSQLLNVFSRPVRILNAKFRSIAWYLKPTQVIDFTFHIFSAATFLVRRADKSLQDFGTQIEAWEIPSSSEKNWAANADTLPSTYATAVSDTFGVWHADLEITKSFNDTITLTTTAGLSPVTLIAGIYASPFAICTMMQTQINGISTTHVNVTYDITTRKFTLATVDASNFTIHWTTTPEIGRSILGFDVSSNDTGANTYTADYISIFDYADGEAASQWA